MGERVTAETISDAQLWQLRREQVTTGFGDPAAFFDAGMALFGRRTPEVLARCADAWNARHAKDGE